VTGPVGDQNIGSDPLARLLGVAFTAMSLKINLSFMAFLRLVPASGTVSLVSAQVDTRRLSGAASVGGSRSTDTLTAYRG
jgi:hypothetical protein